MKICSVKFKNINSLQGEHTIPFDAPPLSESGLFALTGVTGAGKTTILDAITVALYGDIPRFKTTDVREIMTRGTGECWSEAEFESGGKRYRSKWSAQRAYKKAEGALQQPKMELAELPSGGFIETYLSKVPAKVAEITGLTMEQFLRSVMLAQGDFAAFLKAKENERGELLERMAGTDEFSRISMAAFEKTKSENENLKKLTDKIDESRLIQDEERERITAEQAEFFHAAENAKNAADRLREAKTWRENITKTEGEIEITRLKLEEKIAAKVAFSEKAARLELHRKAAPFYAGIVKLDDIMTEISTLKQERETWEVRLPELETAKNTADIKALTAAEALEKSKEILRETLPLIEAAEKFDWEIAAKTKTLGEEQAKLAKLSAELSQKQRDIQSAITNLAQVENTRNELNLWLEANAADVHLERDIPAVETAILNFDATKKRLKEKENAAAEMRAILENLEKEQASAEAAAAEKERAADNAAAEAEKCRAVFGEILGEFTVETLVAAANTAAEQKNMTARLLDSAKIYAEKQAKLLKLRTDFQQITADKKAKQDEEKTAKTAVEEAEKLAEALQKILEQEQLIQKYEDDRKRLTDGESCPLCGSVHHPFAEEHHAPEVSAAAQNVENQKGIVQEARENLSRIEREFSRLEEAAKRLETDGITQKKELERLEHDFSERAKNLENRADIQDVEAIERLVQSEEQRQAFLNEKYTDAISAQKNLEKSREKKLETEREILTSANLVENIRIKTGENQSALNRLTEEITVRLQEVGQEQAGMSSLLARYGEPAENANDSVKNLRRRTEEFARKSDAIRAAEQNIVALSSMISASEIHRAALEEQTGEAREIIGNIAKETDERTGRRREIFGEKNPAEERNRLNGDVEKAEQSLKSDEQDLQRKKDEFIQTAQRIEGRKSDEIRKNRDAEELRKQLSPAILTSGFDSEEAVRAAWLDDAVRENSEREEQEIHDGLTALSGLLEKSRGDLEAEQAKNLTDETAAELAEKISVKTGEIEEISRKTGAIEERLKQDRELRAEFADITREIEIQRKECVRWQKLNDLIGSEKGDKFRKFAQGLTLVRLVGLANGHLRQLNNRYSLEKIKGKDLSLQIIDGHQADERRAVESLSGGETFLVSLALALGLSDLASAKTQIDSLFIDEGFGTLDAETLDIAMTALEKLQMSGKTIGVISHVETMKERISTQIIVEKKGGGMSALRIIPA